MWLVTQVKVPFFGNTSGHDSDPTSYTVVSNAFVTQISALPFNVLSDAS